MPLLRKFRPILILLLSSACGIAIWFALREKTKSVAPSTQTPIRDASQIQRTAERSSSAASRDQPALIFAGLSGQSPRYIESGPDKGLGYLDQDSREVRKGLIQDGFQVDQEWMTPARIAHEFRKKSPICIYPTEWSRPQELFSQPQDRIYSIPLNLGGEENRFIWVKKTDVHRFKKHLDDKGSVRMTSLIEDAELKTLLVRDKDYGELGRILTQVDAQGDQVVREKFKKHVGVLLLNDSRQMVEMLNANRFDYLLSDEIEDQNWTDAKVDASQFIRIQFSSSPVKGIEDPNLVYHSVSCSLHPLSIRAMPYINKWIASSRGLIWLQKSLLHRAQWQKSQLGGYSWMGSLISRLRGQFEKGALDRWYGLQQKQVPSLKLFPEELNQKESDSPKNASNDLAEASAAPLKRPLWHAKVLPAKKLMIWNDSSGVLFQGGGYGYRFEQVQLFSGKSASNLLSPSEWDLIQTESSPGTQSLSTDLSDRANEVEKLTLFASGLATSGGVPWDRDLSALLPILRSGRLKELTLIGANPQASAWFVENLPKDLRVLNMVSCALSQTKLHLKLPSLNLRELRLDNSQFQTRQLEAALKSLSSKLEVLSLGYLRTLWTLGLAQGFGRMAWPKLRVLNLEYSALNDEQFLEIQKGLSDSLELLSLGVNCLSMKSLEILFRLPFSHLVELDLSGNDLNHRDAEGRTLNFPVQLKRLSLGGMRLTPKQTRLLRLSSHLESLDLEDNPLSDGGLAPLLSQLTSATRVLNLSKTGAGIKTLQLLSEKKWGTLSSLDLGWNLIGDAGLEILKGAGIKLLRLGLAQTGLTQRGLQILGKTWARDLLSLDLSGNSFRAGGLGSFYPQLNPNLRELSLKSNSELDVESLARVLPRTLKNLDLSDAQLSNAEIQVLAPQLPKGLRALNLSRSGFDAQGARVLAKFIPPNLEDLDLEAVPLGMGVQSLLEALPRSLRLLRIGGNIGSLYSSSQIKKIARALPQGLEDLFLVGFQAHGGLAELMGSLPPGLLRLRMKYLKLDQQALDRLGRSWPPNLREVYFEGTHEASTQIDLSHLSQTIERLSFLGVGFDSKEFEKIPENRLDNLHCLQLYETASASRGLQALLRKAHQIRSFELNRPVGIDSQDLLRLKESQLASLSLFGFANVSMSNRSLQHLLSILPSHLIWLNFASVGIHAEGFQSIASSLPRSLRFINISGNPIGQKGLELLRREVILREARGEPVFQIKE